MKWTQHGNDWYLDTGTAIQAKIRQRDEFAMKELRWKQFFAGVGVIRHTGRGQMFDFAEMDMFDTFEEARDFAEKHAKRLARSPGSVFFKYSIERRKSLNEFVTDEWQPLADIIFKHIEAGRSEYYIKERMLKTAKSETRRGNFELKKVSGRYHIRKA